MIHQAIMCMLLLQDKGLESMEGKDGAGYRAVLYTCVAAHWVTLLAAVAVAGTLPVTPLALLGACHILSTPRLPTHA